MNAKIAALVLAATALGIAVAVPRARTRLAARALAVDTTALLRSITYFEHHFADDSWNYPVGNRLLERYLLRFRTRGEMRDVERAEELARHLARIVPDRASGLARLSVVLLMQHQFAEAYDVAVEATSADSQSTAARAALFDAAIATGRYAIAESALASLPRATLAREVRRAQWLEGRGYTEAAWLGLDRVCSRLQRSSARREVVAWCLTELAHLELARRGERAAESRLREALAVQPGYRGALEVLADLAYAKGRWKEAHELYARLVTDAHADLYLRLAETQYALGDSTGGGRSQARFLHLARSREGEALYGRELALYYVERASTVDTALAIALREVARRPAVESYQVLSWVRLRRGEVSEALEASDRARAWGTPSPTMDYQRGRILEAMGKVEEGRRLSTLATRRPSLLAPHARRDLEARRTAPGRER